VGNEGGIFKLYKIAVGGSWNEFINQSTIDSMDLSGSMAISGTSANDLVSCVSDPVYGFCMGAAPGGVNSVYGVYVASLHGIVNASSGSGSGLSSTFVSLNNRFVQVSGVSPVYAATHVDQYGLSAFIIGSTSGGTTIPRLLVIRDSDGAVVLNETMSIGGLTALFMNIQYFDGYILIGISTIVNQYIAMYKVNSGSSVELKDFELSGSEGGKGSVFLGSSGSSVFVMTQTITNKRLHTFSKTSNNFSASVDVLASASADYLYWSDTAKKSYARGANIYYYPDIMSLSGHTSVYSSVYGDLQLWNGNTNDIRILTSGGKKLKGSTYVGLSAAGPTLPSGFVAYGFRDDRMIIGTIPGGVGLSKYWHFVDWSDDALPILVNTTILTVLHSNYSNYGAAPYLSGAAIGTNEIVALQAAIQPILGTYGFSVDRLSYTLGSVPIPSGTINGTFVEYACYVPTDTSFSKVASYSSIDQLICPSSLSVATLGRPVVASGEGLIDIVAGRRIYNLTMEEGVTPAIVDYTSDTFADALFLSDGIVKFLTSSPINQVAQGAFIRMTNVTCSYNEVTRRIDTTGVGVAAKNPTKVTFFADLFNSKGARITYFSNKVNKISSPVVVSDSYTVQYTVLDDLTNEKVTLNCSVDVQVALNVSLNGCSLGNDGEFNFLDSSTRHNWFVSIFNRREVANEPSMVDSAVARFGSGSGIFHPLFCADEGISLDTRLKVGSNAKLEVNVKGQKDGVNYVAAGFILKSNNGVVTVYKMTGSGNMGEIQGDSISSFNVNEYKVISLRVNQLLNEFAILVDGENKG
jgi:hypothetical protein